jgi:hypothetical protein
MLENYKDVETAFALNIGNNSLESYTQSMIELPPSIEKIYATKDLINGSSRFNHGTLSNSVSQLMPLVTKETQLNTMRRIEEIDNASLIQQESYQQQ